MSRSSIKAAAMKGTPLDCLVIDAHAHLGGFFNYYHIPYGQAHDVVRHMDAFGIDEACVFSFAGVNSDFRLGNDLIAAAISKFPKRLHGFVTLNLNYPETWIPELERCRGMGFVGIKLIGEYQFRKTEQTALDPVYEYASEHGMVMLNHHWGEPGYLKGIALRNPEACFVIGHYSLAYEEVANGVENVYQCTCVPLGYRQVEEMVERIDPRKIVFGSDLTDLDPGLGLAPIAYAEIPESKKRLILGKNMRRVLDRAKRA